jgi:ABC-type nitrate/sulfonate/bicarbonate transport system substrate-binding protein
MEQRLNARQVTIPFLIIATLYSFGVLFAQDLPKVTIGHSSRSIEAINLYVAEQHGFFKAEGLDVRLVQIRANIAIAAALAGDLDVTGSISSTISAIQKGAPIKVLAVSLNQSLFFLVARPELKSISDLKGKTLGVTTIGGAQDTALRYMLRKGGLNPNVDVTIIVAGDVPTQLQGLVANTIQGAALSPPPLIAARDRLKMNVLGSVINEYPTLQNGIAVPDRIIKDRPRVVRGILRARTRANKLFLENQQAAIGVIAKTLNVDQETARETYILSRPAFTQNGVVTEKEANEYLRADAERLKIKEPMPFPQVFNFSLQIEVNKELGVP